MKEPLRRAFDLLVSGTVLLLSTPILLGAMLAIRLESRGGAIYRQRRVGKDGAAFDVLKLRTMVSGAEKMGAGLAPKGEAQRLAGVGGQYERRAGVEQRGDARRRHRGRLMPARFGDRGHTIPKRGHRRAVGRSARGYRHHGASRRPFCARLAARRRSW